jgi:hypothetical protein
MASTRIKLKSSGMAALLKDSGVRSMLTERAERVLATAQSIAPVASGAYRGSLHLEQDTTDRAVVRVVASVDYSHVVEANSGTLARAIDSAGGS